MFYQALIINDKNSELLPLTQGFDTFGDPVNYTTVSITGLDQPRSQINLTKSAILDGALFNSATVDTRNIVITIKIKSDHVAVRSLINRVCTVKDLVHFYYGTGNADYEIDGYVESVAYNLFEQSEVVQISLICPNPNFKVIPSLSEDYVEVPLLYQDNGESRYTNITTNTNFDIGFKIEVQFNTNATYFMFRKELYPADSLSQYYGEILNGDKIIINYYKNNFEIVRRRGSTDTSILQDFSRIDFFQLSPNVVNKFAYYVRNEDAKVTNLAVAKLYYQNEVRGI